jgi:hypothetical protein
MRRSPRAAANERLFGSSGTTVAQLVTTGIGVPD